MVYHFCQSEGEAALLVIPPSDPRGFKVREMRAGCQVMETAGERQILGYFLKCSSEASWHYCAFYMDRNYQQRKMRLSILKETV